MQTSSKKACVLDQYAMALARVYFRQGAAASCCLLLLLALDSRRDRLQHTSDKLQVVLCSVSCARGTSVWQTLDCLQ
jgi:hypothetical protein